jgi:hypothetical protein
MNAKNIIKKHIIEIFWIHIRIISDRISSDNVGY